MKSYIKKEINSIIIQLNETTLTNISLIEEKLKGLDKKIILADKKTRGLSKGLEKIDLTNQDLFVEEQKKSTYTPQKIVKQSQKTAENFIENDKKLKILEEIEKMPISQQASFLLHNGWAFEEIQRQISISSGELELLANIEGMKEKE